MSMETEIAARADELIRECFCAAYEILYDGDDDMYVIAAPADESEGGDPKQPTAINIGYDEDYDPETDLPAYCERCGSRITGVGEPWDE